MIQKRRTSREYSFVLITSVFLICSGVRADGSVADAYRAARAELVDAYQRQDYATMRLAAAKALVARPEYPGALFNLALAYALNDQAEDSLRILTRILRKGADFGVAGAEEFADLRELPGWHEYLRQVELLYEPVGDAIVAASYDFPTFVPEGIAIDRAGDIHLGSIRTGMLVRATGKQAILSDANGHWSVFGMRFHEDGSLWFASAAVPQFDKVGDDEGKTGLFRLDVASGTITRAAYLPEYAEAQVLGDLLVADANTIYATDSVTGAVYRYHVDANEYEILVEQGELGSPQGLVLDATGDNLYVADYIGGIFRISLDGGSLSRVVVDPEVTDFGIDGLYRAADELIAIQNGIRPSRVTAFRLSADGMSLTGARVLVANHTAFDEPTLGTMHGDDFYFIANSHWNRFDAENELPDKLSGPVILKVSP